MKKILINGKVFYNYSYDKTLNNFIKRAMIIWGQDNYLDRTKEPYSYRVWFTKKSNNYSCEIIINNNNGQSWESSLVGTDNKKLFLNTLNKIIPFGSIDNLHSIAMDKILKEYNLWPA